MSACNSFTHFARTPAIFLLSLLLLLSPAVWPQVTVPSAPVAEAKPEPAKDPLGRTTPRGAVLGFLNAARKGNTEIAVLYLNTPLRGPDAADLARQLAMVLDRRLPARLNSLSDKPEGAIPDPLNPDEDLVGTITTAKGDLDIFVERVDRGKLGKTWLFSRKTLQAIPDVFQEIGKPPVEEILPEFLVNRRLAKIPLFEWLTLFVGLPFLYMLTGIPSPPSTRCKCADSSSLADATSPPASCPHHPLVVISRWPLTFGAAVLVHHRPDDCDCRLHVAADPRERLRRTLPCWSSPGYERIGRSSAPRPSADRRVNPLRGFAVHSPPLRH